MPVASDVTARARLFDVAFWAIALLTAGFAFASFYWPFISGQEAHFHDSSVPATEIGLFYDRLYGSDSWLWSAALNSGQPLWVSLETMPFFDPIAFVVYSVAVALKADWWTPYYVTVFTWMFALAWGGALCTLHLTRNRGAALLTFILLLAGPLALAIPSQSNGFLIPFRYFPLAFYFYLRLRQSVTPTALLYFTTTIAFGLAGYQSAYVFVLFLGLGLSELLVGGRTYLAWLRQLLRPRYNALFLIPLACVAPLVFWLAYLQDLVSISRTYRHGHIYFVELSRFAGDLLYAYLNVIGYDQQVSIWHGSSFLGMFVLPFLFLGFRRSILAAVAARWRPIRPGTGAEPYAAIWLWLLISIALTTGLFGVGEIVRSQGDLLGIRNYGFLLTGCLFLLALIAGCGVSEVAAGRYRLGDVLTDTLIFAILAGGSMWWSDGAHGDLQVLAASIAIFAIIAFLWHRLATRLGVTWTALPCLLVIFAELMLNTHDQLPTLTAAAALADQREAANLAQTRAPDLGQSTERLTLYRNFDYPGADYWPYHFEGPAVFKVAYAYGDPYHLTPLSPLGLHGLSHFFRVGAYDALLRNRNETDILKAILGVSRPVLELVPQSEIASDPAGGLAFVLRDVRRRSDLPKPASGAGKIGVSEFAGDRLVVEVRSPGEAVLVYRDNMAPGWSASLDGKDADLLVVDRVNKAVAVPSGLHRVEFVYRPWAYLVAFALRVLAMLVAVAALAWLAVCAYRKPMAK